jgi:hypothetical protein
MRPRANKINPENN